MAEHRTVHFIRGTTYIYNSYIYFKTLGLYILQSFSIPIGFFVLFSILIFKQAVPATVTSLSLEACKLIKKVFLKRNNAHFLITPFGRDLSFYFLNKSYMFCKFYRKWEHYAAYVKFKICFFFFIEIIHGKYI